VPGERAREGLAKETRHLLLVLLLLVVVPVGARVRAQSMPRVRTNESRIGAVIRHKYITTQGPGTRRNDALVGQERKEQTTTEDATGTAVAPHPELEGFAWRREISSLTDLAEWRHAGYDTYGLSSVHFTFTYYLSVRIIADRPTPEIATACTFGSCT
jgi:hypothetical protein